MKKTLLFLLLTMTGLSVMASPVKPQKALLVAKNFMAQYVKGADQMEATVVYTHPMPKSGQPAMYAVNIGNMFVLVSADDIAHPVLGYSLSRPWPVINDERGMMNDEQPSVSKHSSFNTHHSTLPPQVASYLDDLATQIEAASAEFSTLNSQFSIEETSAEWQQLLSLNSHLLTTTNLPDSVGPLLTTTWDQGQYYNALCPEDAAGPDGHVYTGCVATAMAQIINYWGYPIHGRGTHSYTSNYGTLSVNYDSASYDYAHMPTVLTATSTPQEINAVAQLMYHCGVANIMFYGALSSGALVENTRAAFINHFGYSSKLGFADRHMYTENEWNDLLRAEVASGNPVFYAGTNGIASHAFVLDGYKNDGFFHFNFGWSGYADGWYLTTAINPSWEFNYWQQAIVGIRPDSTEQVALSNFIPLYDVSLSYYSTPNESYTVSSPIHLYNMSAKNDYLMDYSNDNAVKPRIIHFLPSDSNGQLVLDVFNIDISHAVVVYDGANMDSLISVLEPAGVGYPYAQLPNDPAMQQCVTNNFSPIVSTKHGLTVVTFSTGMIEKELHLLVSDASDCRMVSNITKTRDSIGYRLNWTSNGSTSQWQVAWADTLASCDTTFFAINSHYEDDNLEVKIRSVCGEGNYGEWNTVILNQKRYWPDFVEEEPEGFYINGDTVKISSAEGLAWWIKQCNTEDWPTGNDYKTIEFLADIDLEAHLWKAISYYGKVLGNGHTISNLRTAYSYSGNGLFHYYYGDTISDLHLRDAVVCGDGSIGSLVGGVTHAVIINCSSVRYRVRDWSGNIGGLIGGASYSKIINCYAIGDNYGQQTNGGIVGSNHYSEFINCYSSQGQETSFQWLSGNSDLYGPGLISGINVGGTYNNCFADINNTERQWNPSVDSMATLYYFFGFYERDHGVLIESATNVATFRVDGDTIGRIIQDTSVNYNLGENMDLLTALNHKVVETNSPDLRTWEWDSVLHFPVLGGYYEPTCPNVSNIIASNITYDDGTAVMLSWNENGVAEQWQVKYFEEGSSENDAVVYSVFAPNDTVENLTLGHTYYFCVRPICDEDDTVGWSQPVKHYVDKKYWTEVVTQCPAGYVVDNDGNVTISSAEGLAYLDYLNQWQSYEGKTVSIVNDIDMGAYRWKPLVYFLGTIEGNNHTLSNIICRESTSDEDAVNIGFTGEWCRCTVRNITIKDGIFSGMENVGGLFGLGYGGFFENCSIVNALVRGRHFVGGLGGVIPAMDNIETIIKDCSSSGVIYADKNTGGLIGNIQSTEAVINNCYSSCNINSFGKMTLSLRGGLVGSSQGVISNCYSTGNVEYDSTVYYNYSGLSIGDISINGEMHNVYAKYADGIPFEGRDDAWLVYPFILSDTATFDNIGALNSSVTITNTTYTDLLSALNAWVDANDTAGIYRHWAADSANVNGGFPVFAAIPCTPATGSDSITVCDSYTWHGNVYTADATLIDTLSTADGCDSIVTHYLTVKHSNSATETTTACESYFFGGQWLYTSGQYTDTLTNAAGCDSIATLNLTINNPVHTATTVTACDSYTWNGVTITTSGDYTYPHNDDNGCTQVDTLHLTINYSTSSILTDTACEAYFWNGEWRYISGQYSDTLTNAAGCDSIATLNLTINNPVHTATTATACDSYTWQEAVITTSGTYHYTHTDANGCTQDDTLYLTINYSTIGDTTATACDSFTWWNTTYTNSTNTPTHIYTNAAGCDSTVTLHLTINHSTSSIVTDTACEAYFWNGEWQYTSGQYSDTTTNSVGCDSIAILNLTINNPVHTATTVTACDSYTWQEAVITTSGTYHYTHTDAHSCTQDDTLYLTINHNDTVIVDEEVCDSITWYGTAYTASAYGIQYLTVPNTVGCDSIFFLDLTVNYTTYGEMSAVSCDSYQWDWNSAIYTASGDYTYRDTVNQNSQFCDSVLTLHLTINHSATADTTATACDLFVWYGNMGYDVSGDYEHQWWNVTTDGCDSILTLHLTINYSTETTVTDTAEGSYSWHGTTYTESGTYTWNGTTAEGCDSTVTLLLTITPTQAITQSSIQAIKIYPNPTSDLLTIDADDILSVELFDLNGRLVFSSEVDSSPFTFRLSPFTLNAGSYLLRIHTQQGTAVQHVILN